MIGISLKNKLFEIIFPNLASLIFIIWGKGGRALGKKKTPLDVFQSYVTFLIWKILRHIHPVYI
ncbi:MAG: hypothetical protein CM1200mP10_11960 [Candidatus Neomarinimicrobiota bacterium]|nr:MAG: hypothetical protein CM1200mP10_11960 [Candidatus Neomarinimicrobiota bacterium]